MKELSIEEKAKAYDEVIERAKYYYAEGKTLEYADDIVSDIFPELKESEDERVELLNYLYDVHDDDEERARWIAWLEKQGEQKLYGQRQECVYCQFNYAGECKGSCAIKRGEQNPAWSEEDEKILKEIITDVRFEGYNNDLQANSYRKIRWLKSLKDKCLPQPKQEWSEEDIK